MKRQQSGFTLLNILVSVLVFAFGLLGLASVYVNLTSTATQDQNLTALAGLSNDFWGVIQASPTLMLPGATGTYTSGNISSAPAPMQSWLTNVTNALPPGATVTITTGPDATGANAACDPNTGCTMTLNITWKQNATSATGIVQRAQTFYYQYPAS